TIVTGITVTKKIHSELLSDKKNIHNNLGLETVLADLPDNTEKNNILRAESCPGSPTTIPGGSGNYNITVAGSYLLGGARTGDITITANDTCLSLNNFKLTGRIIINGANAKVINGTIEPVAATTNPLAEDAAITINSSGTGAQILDLTVTCLALSDLTANPPSADGINGRLAIKNQANFVQIRGCIITAAKGQGFNITTAIALTINRPTGAGGIGNWNDQVTDILIQNCTVAAGASGGITVSNTSTTATSIGYGGTATIGAGGEGVYTSGANIQILSSTITAGSSGAISATGNSSGVIQIARAITPNSNVAIGAGGNGIYSSGNNTLITGCTIIAGSSGGITENSTG
ncbi:MAG: hypothetical protein U1E13_14935, partial [Methylophilaceae bacterium]|nr:hypothetical protein [Methylophilaceae bacterium]